MFWDQKVFVMPYNCMEVISRPNVIKERIKKNQFGASVIILVLVLVFVKTHATDKKHGFLA